MPHHVAQQPTVYFLCNQQLVSPLPLWSSLGTNTSSLMHFPSRWEKDGPYHAETEVSQTALSGSLSSHLGGSSCRTMLPTCSMAWGCTISSWHSTSLRCTMPGRCIKFGETLPNECVCLTSYKCTLTWSGPTSSSSPSTRGATSVRGCISWVEHDKSVTHWAWYKGPYQAPSLASLLQTYGHWTPPYLHNVADCTHIIIFSGNLVQLEIHKCPWCTRLSIRLWWRDCPSVQQ